MNARAILAKLRQRQTPTRDELGWFARALADGQVSDAVLIDIADGKGDGSLQCW